MFLTSHGWKGDVPAAIEQYDAWIGAMLKVEADRATARQLRPEFMPLIVGLHWPSLPWGDEEIRDRHGRPPESLLRAMAQVSLDAEVDAYAARIAETPRARDALRTISLPLATIRAAACRRPYAKHTRHYLPSRASPAGDASGRPGCGPGWLRRRCDHRRGEGASIPSAAEPRRARCARIPRRCARHLMLMPLRQRRSGR